MFKLLGKLWKILISPKCDSCGQYIGTNPTCVKCDFWRSNLYD